MTIAENLKQLKQQNRKALTPFATVGDPDSDIALAVFRHFAEWGADVVELGIPYSDPLMDGPTLQRSYQRALKAGFKLAGLPAFIENIRKVSGIPMLVMTCFNPILQYGVERFFRDVSSAGVDSLLITDLPPEEWGENRALAARYGLGTILLVTPTTPLERIRYLGELSSPFVYCVTRAGVTGGVDGLPEELTTFARTVRENVPHPVLIGFGISTPEHARAAATLADGVIIGSAIAALIEKNRDSEHNILSAVGAFLMDVRKAVDS